MFVNIVSLLDLCVHRLAGGDSVYLFRYLGNYDGSFEYNSTTCRELRQEVMDVKVLTM